MGYPKSKIPPHMHQVTRNAKRLLFMPGANTLTRELTTMILENYGLLAKPPTTPVPSTAFVRHHAVVSRGHAATLCREVQQLCARARELSLEAESLCKPQR